MSVVNLELTVTPCTSGLAIAQSQPDNRAQCDASGGARAVAEDDRRPEHGLNNAERRARAGGAESRSRSTSRTCPASDAFADAVLPSPDVYANSANRKRDPNGE